MEKQECIKGSNVRLNPCTYTKEEYYFRCWEDDFGREYADQEYVTVESDMHLRAVWSKIGDENDPIIKKNTIDQKVILSIKEYQKQRDLSDEIIPNKWYTVGDNKWYYIDGNLLPQRGWHEEIILMEMTTTKVIIPTPSEAPVVVDKNNDIIAPANIGTSEQTILPSKKISTNVKIENNQVKDYKSKWYYLDTETCLMTLGWKVINKKYYYFATEYIEADYIFDKVSGNFLPNGLDKELGQMYSDEYTPDGRYVNNQGIMVNQ